MGTDLDGSSTLTALSGVASELILDAPVVEGATYSITHNGPANSLAFYLYSSQPSFADLFGYQAHAALPPAPFPFDAIGATGTTTLLATANFVPPGAQGTLLFVQTLGFVNQGGSAVVNGTSSPSVLIAVDLP